MWKILVADDNFANRQVLVEILREYAFCDIVVNGREAWEAYCISIKTATPYDAVLLDIAMPEMNGLELLSLIREHEKKTADGKRLPVIMVTAYSNPFMEAFDRGCDDYILKPFDSEILLSKIRAILKRNSEAQEKQNELFEYTIGGFHFNSKLRELRHGDSVHTLSPKENDLLRMLADHLNDLLPREQALKKIWGSDTYFNGRSMDVYIAKLRKYLKEDEKVEIVNIHGNGFRLVVHP